MEKFNADVQTLLFCSPKTQLKQKLIENDFHYLFELARLY